MLQDNGHIVSGTLRQQFPPKIRTTMEHYLSQKLDFYYRAGLAQASYCNCPLPFNPGWCQQAASQAMLRHRQSAESRDWSSTQYSGGLSVWAVNTAGEGKESVEIRTEDTMPFSFRGGKQAPAQRDLGHKLHAGHAMSGCSTMDHPISTQAQVTPRDLAGPKPGHQQCKCSPHHSRIYYLLCLSLHPT